MDIREVEMEIKRLERIERAFNRLARWLGHDDPETLLVLLDEPIDPRTLQYPVDNSLGSTCS